MEQSFNGRKILVLAGRPIGTCDIVQYARSRGAYTIVTDYLSVNDSPAKLLADECWDVSTSDVDEIVVRALASKVDAVFTGVHDFNLLQAQEVCRRLSLPFYASRQQLDFFLDKSAYKRLFENYGLGFIREYFPGEDVTYPVVVKPVGGSGGYGVKVCVDNEELSSGLAAARSFSGKGVIVEQYVYGDEVTAFYIVRDGKLYLTALADRFVVRVTEDVAGLPFLYIWPSKYLSFYQSNFAASMSAALESLQLGDGMVFVQCIMKDGNIFPYDMGFRLSGSQEYNILSKVCGFNPLEMMVDYSFGGVQKDVSALVSPEFHGKSAANLTFLSKAGQVGKFVGLDVASNISGVFHIVKNCQEGDVISEGAIGTLNQVVLRVFVVVDSEELLYQSIRDVFSTIKVLDVFGRNMLVETSWGQVGS